MRIATLLLTCVLISLAAAPAAADRNLHPRELRLNSAAAFTRTKTGRVAFIGGSITEMNGYRPIIAGGLQKRFPDTKFTFIDAGIASTCSTTGSHRLEEDVFSKAEAAGGKVDLFFVEFAVNDDQDAHHAKREAIRGMEGIIRQCRRHNPQMDIVVTHFVNEGMLATFAKGGVPVSIEAHEAVCEHYGVASVNLAKEVSQSIESKSLTWKAYGGVHPGPVGNTLAATLCVTLLETAWGRNAGDTTPVIVDAVVKPIDYKLPEKPLDEGNYGAGQFVDVKEAKLAAGWTVEVPDWKKISGSFRDRFGGKALLLCSTPHEGDGKGSGEVKLDFEGQAIGVYVLAGPDAGTVEVSIDGGEWKKVNLYHNYSGGLHYPRTAMLATDLKSGKHTLAMRMSAEHDKRSKGTAARILKFAVN